jgi:hypothetical protein
MQDQRRKKTGTSAIRILEMHKRPSPMSNIYSGSVKPVLWRNSFHSVILARYCTTVPQWPSHIFTLDEESSAHIKDVLSFPNRKVHQAPTPFILLHEELPNPALLDPADWVLQRHEAEQVARIHEATSLVEVIQFEEPAR